MENKKKCKGSLVAIIILGVCVLGLGCFIGYDKFIKDNSCPKCKETKCTDTKVDDKKDTTTVDTKTDTTTDTKEVSYTYEEMEGLYKTSLSIDMDDSVYNAGYYLILDSDGTFRYTYYVVAKEGYMGNYIIEGNKIKLNKLFRTGSDIGLEVIEGTKELTINEDKTITDDDQPYSQYSDTKTITFTKTDEPVDDNFYYMLKQYKLVNEYKGN